MRSLRVLLALVAVALTATATARADVVGSQDDQGRAITFDVQAPDVDVDFYARVLRGALHGNEISRVTVRIVPFRDLQWQCGDGAAACYFTRRGGATIVVPAGRGARVAETLLHEYGHHVDATWPVAGVREPNGTEGWWAARGMQALLDARSVARDYGLGWERSVGEIFAEDYVQLHTRAPYAITWLAPPDEAALRAIATDLGSEPPALPAEQDLARPPLVIRGGGTLRPGARRAVPFTLLGPGRRVTFSATVVGAKRAGTRARMEVRCNGRTTASRGLARGQLRGRLDRRNLGPAQCAVVLRSTSRAAHRFSYTLRLAVESAT